LIYSIGAGAATQFLNKMATNTRLKTQLASALSNMKKIPKADISRMSKGNTDKLSKKAVGNIQSMMDNVKDLIQKNTDG